MMDDQTTAAGNEPKAFPETAPTAPALPRKRSRTWFWVLGGVLAALVVTVAVVLLFFRLPVYRLVFGDHAQIDIHAVLDPAKRLAMAGLPVRVHAAGAGAFLYPEADYHPERDDARLAAVLEAWRTESGGGLRAWLDQEGMRTERTGDGAAIALLDAADAPQWSWAKDLGWQVVTAGGAADSSIDARVQALAAAVQSAVANAGADPARVYLAGRASAAP